MNELTTVARIPEPQRSLSDYYRSLYKQVRSQLADIDAATIGITSCQRGEGVTTVASGLACSVARDSSQPVLLVDANFMLGARERLEPDPELPGVADILEGRESVAPCILPTAVENLFVLPAGRTSAPGVPHDSSDSILELVTGLRAHYPWILFDLPVANEMTECFLFARHMSGVLLVIEAERVRHQIIRRAKDQLLQCDTALLGVVPNKRRKHVPDWLYRRL